MALPDSGGLLAGNIVVQSEESKQVHVLGSVSDWTPVIRRRVNRHGKTVSVMYVAVVLTVSTDLQLPEIVVSDLKFPA